MDEPDTTPIPSGGDDSALDLSSERDRGLVRQAIKNWPDRWRGVRPNVKEAIVDGLEKAQEKLRPILDKVSTLEEVVVVTGVITSIAKTVTVIEGQRQKDEHRAVELIQGDVHHREKLAAEREKPAADNVMRILIVDARTGHERACRDIGEFHDLTVIDAPADGGAPKALPVPVRDPAPPGPEQDRKGRAPRR